MLPEQYLIDEQGVFPHPAFQQRFNRVIIRDYGHRAKGEVLRGMARRIVIVRAGGGE
jgi:hypothetical protein